MLRVVDETALRQTLVEYTDSFNRVVAAGWPKRRVNGVELHHATYALEREITDLPSQLVCSARAKATESLAAARTLQKKFKRRKASAKPRTVSMPQSKRCAIRYDARSATINLAAGTATLASVAGRQKCTFTVAPHHAHLVEWAICSSDLVIDRKGRLWLHIGVSKDTPAVVPNGIVVGVDLGVNRPAVTSTNLFLGSKHWEEVENRDFRLRRALQAKGTKSAKRHLKRLSGRRGRFRQDCDHVLSKRIVKSVTKGTTIALEDLTDIRDRVRARKKERRRLHGWSFARLDGFLVYKAELAGVEVAFVDPRYTSQKCSRCGHIEKANRHGASFECVRCGLRLNADLNAARNIATNHRASMAIRRTGGLPVNQPIVEKPASHVSSASLVI